MKIAIMQPYLFPHIGYFQLINAVDKFIFLNDVNYIKKGWINRNRILLNGKDHLFTVPIEKSSQNRLINEVVIADDQKKKNKLLQTIESAYLKADNYNRIFDLVKPVINTDQRKLDAVIVDSIRLILNYLGIEKELEISANIKRDKRLKGAKQIIEICKVMNGSHYVNPIGGRHLYNEDEFRDNKLNLSFIESKPIVYRQFGSGFIEGLSIIDVLMFNSVKKIKFFLNEYNLIS